MKKIILSVIIIVIISSCNKSLDETNLAFQPLAPQKIDLNAGAWKPILLSAPDEFTLAPPVATTSPQYIAETNEIKGWQQNLSSKQKEVIKYWSAGAVLRWNEILRELVAKRNLPPYQNED